MRRLPIHQYFMHAVYTAIMTIAALSFLFLIAFQSVSFPVLGILVPKTMHASYADATVAASVGSPFLYTFGSDGTLYETGNTSESSSPYFWLNSGAKLPINGGTGRTLHGSLSSIDPWRLMYKSANPVDTDNGYRPQNIFRLVSRNQWDNVRLETLFKINADNFSSSPNRNASNGLLHMLRYRDNGDTLYYVGIRVDGYAVIKKKYKGTYSTLATKKIYAGTYAVANNVNLLPHGGWIAMKSEAITNGDGSVTIRQYVKNPGETSYTKVLEVVDTSSPITGSGYLGIRTDFMDVEFDNFRAEKI